MSKKQTALMMAIEKIDKVPTGAINEHNRRLVISILTELLPTEREQIEGAWNDAYGGSGHLEASDYFEQTYGE